MTVIDEIDSVFGENGYLPQMPVEGSGVKIPCDIYAVYVYKETSDTVWLNGWINCHSLGNGEKTMRPVLGFAKPESSLSDLHISLCLGELPLEWYSRL